MPSGINLEDENDRKRKEIQKSYEFYQSALRNKDKEPEIYRGARIRYFTLTKGDAWLQQEKQKIQGEKLDPEVEKYREQYEMLKSEVDVQKGYTDSISDIRDKQSALKTSATGNIDFLGKLLKEKETKMSAYNRYIELTTPAPVATTQQIKSEPIPLVSYFAGFPASFMTILDVVLAIMILFFVYLAYYKGRAAYNMWRYGTARPA